MLVRCPAHTDGNPSLLVSLKPDGMALVHCRAGCAKSAVLEAAGLTEAQLYGVTGQATLSGKPPSPLGSGAIAAVTVYVEAAASAFAGSAGAEYAFRRFGVTEDLAAELRLGFDDGTLTTPGRDHRSASYMAFPRLVVPFLDWDGVPRGLQGRDVTERCPSRWVNLKSPRGSRWDTTGVLRTAESYETVIVTEGPGDGLSFAAVGYTVMFVRGAGVARSERAAREVADAVGDARLIIATDHDPGGTGFLAALGAALVEHGKHPLVLDYPERHKDPTSWREADPAIFPRAVHEAVNNARPWTPAPADEAKPAPASSRLVAPMEGTDVENARRALEIVGPDTAYVEGVGFLSWNGKVWEVMTRSRENAIGHRVADVMARELAELPRGDKDGSQEEKREAAAYEVALRRTRRMHMDSGIRAALDHLKTITGAEVFEFDAHPHLLTFANGVVDLRTGKLGAHDRAHRLTKFIDHEFVPEATAPRWERFLAEVFPDDPEMPAYMRRLVGYGITGETREHAFALLHGHGANGKSVLVNTLADIFSGITGHLAQAAVAYVRTYDPGAANPALAALRGVRLAVLSELSDGLRLNEALLKQLTAGDPITARELYKGVFTFSPSALLLMATNFRPDVRGQDDGFWRRTRLIPFTRSFGAGERDPMLARTLAEEAPGIIAWAVAGAREWYARGLADPATVADAVESYRAQSDVLDGFLPGVLVRDPGGSVLLKHAFSAFQDWRDEEQVEQVAKWGTRTLLRNLEARKITAARSSAGKKLLGVRLALPGD